MQHTLARACCELSQMQEMPPLRPWLFRIAHNRAIAHWRREARRGAEPLDPADPVAAEAALEPENALARSQAVQAALSTFPALSPAQRGCVILLADECGLDGFELTKEATAVGPPGSLKDISVPAATCRAGRPAA